MADNYLEKRMDDYRSGKLGRPSAQRKPREATARVLLRVEGECAYLCSLLAALTASGCQATFVGDLAEGNLIAQATASMYVPKAAAHKLSQLRPKGFDVELQCATEGMDIGGVRIAHTHTEALVADVLSRINQL